MNNTVLRNRIVISFVATTLAAAKTAVAQSPSAPESADSDLSALTEIVITGMRGQTRTVQESPVPIDVIGQEELRSVPQTDTLDVLQTLIPSYTVSRQPNSTTGTFIRPIRLRGLSEDKTLLLLNSKRRHKSASVAIEGSGAQGPDAAIIPAIALRTVEVLRDGAAAQYGSDAIAGVINFLLKEDREGFTVTVQGGQYYQGDGADYQVAANMGLPLTDTGFINITAEYTNAERTTRARQYKSETFDAIEYARQNPEYAKLVDLSKPLQRWGRPKAEAFRAIINSGIDLSEDARIYAFANFSDSTATADANYRYPGNGQPVNDVPVRLEDGRVFTFTELFPAGFKPLFSGDVTDYSATAGYRSSLSFEGDRSLSYDFSVRYGRNSIAYRIVNTVNPSLGPDSPRSFNPSEYINAELALNADFSYRLPVSWLATPLVISTGAEYRDENYKMRPGDPASWTPGPYATPDPHGFCNDDGTPTEKGAAIADLNCADPTDPVYRVLAVGSNGINGVPPTVTGSWDVRSTSLYAEATADILPAWFVDLAARFEDYSAFGSTLNGKFAMRYQLTDSIGIRGSIGTGFHAPTPGLLNMTSVSIRTVNGVFTQAGLFPAHNPVAVFLGAKPLEPEEATNYTAGITLSPFPGFALTIDGYLIKIRDQIYSTSPINVTPEIRDAMVRAGVAGADSIASVNFFQNAFDSTTSGVDVVGTYRRRWGNGQSTTFTTSFNYNRYEIDEVKIANLFNHVSIFNFENQPPRWRSVLSVTHEMGPLTMLVRGNIYGPYEVMLDRAPDYPTQKFHTETMIDVELTSRLTDQLTVTIGGRNIFDNYPQPDLLSPTAGRIYRADSVVDWQGGFYYARFTYSF